MITGVYILGCLALGMGLAMDAFSVSLADALREPKMKKGRMLCLAGTYALFQMAMPMIGWFFVDRAGRYLGILQRYFPGIACVLLFFIAIQMIREGLEKRKTPEEEIDIRPLGLSLLLLQALATSVDALSTGFAFGGRGPLQVFLGCGLIGGLTFFICLGGLILGRKAGRHLAWKASILGGVILLVIGVKILLQGL